MSDIHSDKILILDFGSQYTQLIARRVRECHVYCELHPFDLALNEIKAFQPTGIILSGGPKSVYEDGAPAIVEELFESKKYRDRVVENLDEESRKLNRSLEEALDL